jgi:hypothetical protein
VQAMIDDNKARAIDHMRPCAAGLYRHQHASTLFEAAGLPSPPVLSGTFLGRILIGGHAELGLPNGPRPCL